MRNTAIIALLVFTVIAISGCGGGSTYSGENVSGFKFKQIGTSTAFNAFINETGDIFTGTKMILTAGATNNLSGFNPAVAIIKNVSSSSYITGYGDSVKPYVWNLNGTGQWLHITDESLVGAYSPRAVNNSGINVGDISLTDGTNFPARSESNGSVKKLAIPNGYMMGVAYDINDDGTAVGFVSSSLSETPYHKRAAVWDSSGNVKVISDADYSVAQFINNHGDIAGQIDSSAIVWDSVGSVLRQMYPPSGYTALSVSDFNDNGEMVGFVQKDGVNRPVFWSSSGSAILLSTLTGAKETYATSINNAGIIVGWAGDSGEGPWKLVRWTRE